MNVLKHYAMHAEALCDACRNAVRCIRSWRPCLFLLAHMCWFQHCAESNRTGPNQRAHDFLGHHQELPLSGAALPCSVGLRFNIPCGEAGHNVKMTFEQYRCMEPASADDHSITTAHHAQIALGTFFPLVKASFSTGGKDDIDTAIEDIELLLQQGL
jgi:hypothetical protein